MKILPTTIHGILDYCIATAMICTPFFTTYDFSAPTSIILIAGGLAVIINALATNYELGIFRNVSMINHLRIDALIAMLICLLPIMFPFDHYSFPLMYGSALFIMSIITNKTAYYKMFRSFTYRKFEKFPSYKQVQY